MIELLGKIIVAKAPNDVFLFRLNQLHIDSGLCNIEGLIINEANTLEKRIWFDAFEAMEATSQSDMGLQFTDKQYNKILKLCTQDMQVVG
jgi:hypothetical protein